MEKKCEYGVIEYRKPNMLEGLEFLGKMGLNSSNLADGQALMDNDLYYTAQAIKNMKGFISKIDMKIDDKPVTTYEDLTDRMEFMPVLMEVAGELMSFMQVEDKKKP